MIALLEDMMDHCECMCPDECDMEELASILFMLRLDMRGT